MRVEKTQSAPNFGMAYYIKGVNPNKNYYKYDIATKQMSRYVGLRKWGVCTRGYQQFLKEMNKLTIYDVAFDHETKAMQVIERATGEVVKSFDKSTKWQKGVNNPNKTLSPLKAIYSYIFDPKQFLPYNMLQAGKEAEKLEKLALGIEK